MGRQGSFTNRIASIQQAIGLAAAVLAASGCKVGPNFQPPQSVVNCQWSLSPPPLHGEPTDVRYWWGAFQDPLLDGLVQQVLAQNLTLREAGQRVLEARARLAVVRGELFPQVQALEAAYAKARISSTTANFFSQPGIFVPDLNIENYAVGFTASWELDFWGRYRRMIESADATLGATAAAMDEVRVLLVAETARAYVQMRTFERRLVLARQNADIQRRTLDMVKKKSEGGVATGIDLAQAEANFAQTEALIPAFEILRLQTSHRLCLLLGRNPADLGAEFGVTASIPRPQQDVAFGIPADLLRRRPDVRRAERELEAQSARIGIAKSEFYPHISLNGNLGYQSEDFGKLFRSTSSVGAISPRMTWNLLNYCRIKSNVAAEQAAFCRLAYAYQQAVLNAMREAEDAQVAFVLTFDKAAALNTAVDSSVTAVERAEKAFAEGATDYGRVYVLQTDLVRQQDRLAETEGEIATNLITVYQSLGGGWERQACLPSEAFAPAFCRGEDPAGEHAPNVVNPRLFSGPDLEPQGATAAATPEVAPVELPLDALFAPPTPLPHADAATAMRTEPPAIR